MKMTVLLAAFLLLAAVASPVQEKICSGDRPSTVRRMDAADQG